MIRKKYGYTASVAQGTNKVIACSKADWGAIRDNSFITFERDDVFYKVLTKRKFLYKKSVTILNNTQLKINENAGAMLAADDEISFSYDEYEVKAANINNGGSGYEVGDILSPEGGVYKYNSIDELDVPAQVTVSEVDSDGKILEAELTNPGAYNVSPENSCNATSGSGEGASLSLTCGPADVSPIEDRGIVSVDLNSDHTIIHLDHSLPPRIQAGEIKTEKWELTLNINYVGDSKFSAGYEIVKDFTPNFDLPLIHSKLNSSYLVYNEAMAILDQRIKDIEDKLSSEENLGP